MIEVRMATLGDSATISALAQTTFKETFGDLFRDPLDLQRYLKATFSIEKLTRSLQKDNNVFWIASFDQAPIGYGKLKLHSPSPLLDSDKAISQLQKIYVLKEYLGHKVGLALQAQMINRAKSNNSTYLWLSVLNSNTRAIQFYIKIDFIKIGEHTFTIGKETFDFDVMSLNLRTT